MLKLDVHTSSGSVNPFFFVYMARSWCGVSDAHHTIAKSHKKWNGLIMETEIVCMDSFRRCDPTGGYPTFNLYIGAFFKDLEFYC